ncbi:hypothetical protein BOH66_01055 [Microbacterium aurum]|uniref:IrrE N-terminal-like domain-containing protein n=1 Tax=Microbacterium aurum TaxID=36805 RepID=A0A1P8U4K3_9MICO|nr:ImmA/IrrE family metallo-endopeptidase [Microbacterium aurum]APZ33039.1 hypothetical protein BOH66_01055 [Microbacterium aurum]MBM7826594.1 hypothetical protein [Microbacterium aurum]
MNVDACVRLAVAAVPSDVRAGFIDDPLETMTGRLGLTVRAAPQLASARADGGFCDGMSFLDDGVILYRPTGNRRENFTLAHELGHYIVNTLDRVVDWLADNDDDGRVLETICDRFARELLLPTNVAAELVGRGPVRARHVLELYSATSASHPVCMIALAQQMRELGAIALIDRTTGEVTDASVRPDPELGWPKVIPWRGQRMPQGHHLLGLEEGTGRTERLTWHGTWGDEDFFIDAVGARNKIVCVFAATDIWTPGSAAPLISRDFDTRPHLRGTCCGRDFQVAGYPCPKCKKPFCPSCGLCPCQRSSAADALCDECFRLFRPHLLEGGLCVECR